MTRAKADAGRPARGQFASTIPEVDTRRGLFAKLREEVEILHAFGLKREEIASVLEIDLRDVRALCPTPRKKATSSLLPRRALIALLNGRHAIRGGATLAERTQRLADIASHYTEEEFSNEPGVGAVTVIEVSLWLSERGYSFRLTRDAHVKSRGFSQQQET